MTTSRPCGCQRSRCSCHTGRSKRQPHHDAHATSNTFWPCRLDSLNGLPSASGSSSSGATAEVSDAAGDRGLRTERPDAVRLVGDERHAEPLARGRDASRRPSARADLGRAAGRTPRALHAPCGLIAQPVRVSNSCSSTVRSCRITVRTIDADGGRGHARAPVRVRDAALGGADLGAVPGLRPLDRLRADGEARRRAVSRATSSTTAGCGASSTRCRSVARVRRSSSSPTSSPSAATRTR